MDSNHRRRSRRIYSPLHLAALQPFHITLKWISVVPRTGIEPLTYKRFDCVMILSNSCHSGASNRNRTSDTRIFSPLLYRLSYRGIIWRPGRGSNPRPPAWQAGALTNWATGPNCWCFILCLLAWWAFTDLNRGPTGYEPVALTNWAKGPYNLWSRWRDSNSQPHGPKPRALPLALHLVV